jgi:hypothetical protein
LGSRGLGIAMLHPSNPVQSTLQGMCKFKK